MSFAVRPLFKNTPPAPVREPASGEYFQFTYSSPVGAGDYYYEYDQLTASIGEIIIAWNGVEKYRYSAGGLPLYDSIDPGDGWLYYRGSLMAGAGDAHLGGGSAGDSYGIYRILK